jgi:hypothetical protein
VALGVALLVAGFALLNWNFVRPVAAEWNRADQLHRAGVVAQGRIVKKWRDAKSGILTDRWMVTYTFSADDRVNVRDAALRQDTYRRLRPGTPIPVRYLPTEPSISVMPLEESMDTERELLALVAFPVCMILALVCLVPPLRSRQLLGMGQPAHAKVTKVEWKLRSAGSSWVQARQAVIHYQFHDSAGRVVRNKSTTGGLGTGGPRTVLYAPGKPRRNALYPLAFAAVEGIERHVRLDLERLAHRWLPPAELAATSSPRPARLTGWGKVSITGGVLFIALTGAAIVGVMIDPKTATGGATLLYVVGAVATSGLLLGAGLIQLPRRAKELLRSGIPTAAVITRVDNVGQARYSFLDANGLLRTGSTLLDGFKNISGDRTVLYDRLRARRNLLYPSDLATLNVGVPLPTFRLDPSNPLRREWRCVCGTELRLELERPADLSERLIEIGCPKCGASYPAVPQSFDEGDRHWFYRENGEWIEERP